MIQTYKRIRPTVGWIVFLLGIVSLIFMSSPLDKKFPGRYQWSSEILEWICSILFGGFVVVSVISFSNMQGRRTEKIFPFLALLLYLGFLLTAYLGLKIKQSSILTLLGYTSRIVLFGLWPFVSFVDLLFSFMIKKGA